MGEEKQHLGQAHDSEPGVTPPPRIYRSIYNSNSRVLLFSDLLILFRTISTVFTQVVCSPYLYPVRSPQSAFYTYFMFYTQSIFSSPRFIPRGYFIPSPQSVVCSPQSIFYTTDGQTYLLSKDAIFFSFSVKCRVKNKQT